jgi:PAS domain S-box-containing protein
MQDETKTTEQIINELTDLRQRAIEEIISELVELRQRNIESKASEAERGLREETLNVYSEELRQLAEERAKALQVSGEKLRGLFESITDGILVTDFNLVVTDVNQRTVGIHGFGSRDEILGRSAFELIAQRDHPKAARSMEETVEKGTTKNIEYTFLKANGSRFPVELSTSLLKDACGNPAGFIAIMRDITEHKKIEETVNLLSTAVETSADAISVASPVDGKLVFCNDAFLEWWKVKGDYHDLAYRDCFDVDRNVVETAAQATIEGGWTGELTAKAMDGQTFPVLVTSSPVANKDGRTIGLLSILRDTTERKQAEEALKKAVTFFESVISSAVDAIAVTDSEGKLIQFNEAFSRMTKYSDEELKNMNFLQLIPEKWLAEDEMQFAKLLQGMAVTNSETELFRKDGSVFPVALSLSPLTDEEGKRTIMVIARDITEQKQVEEELKRSNTELEQFAYVASHDLQEPLRMVASYTQLLAKRYHGKLDAEADEFIAYAVDGANRMQALLNGLLDYSRLGTRGKPFKWTFCEAVFDQAVANMKVAIEHSRVLVSHDPLPTVMADEGQLVQLFQNLIGNAIKFCSRKRPRIRISAVKKNKDWVFSVRDNGIGIDPQYAERIFVIFQRLHTKEEYDGTGIGLAICKKIVERHGGRIWVESQLGEGSTFYFTIPVAGGE